MGPCDCIGSASQCILGPSKKKLHYFIVGPTEHVHYMLTMSPHGVCNRLSFQSTHALLCVGTWSTLGMIKDSDIKAALGEEVTGEEDDLPANWAAICS
jgi:hypothetical protein